MSVTGIKTVYGVFVIGLLVKEPKYFPSRLDKISGEHRPESMQIGIDVGELENQVLYVPVVAVAGKKAGDEVQIGPLRPGRNGKLYWAER
jgi:hypothetical protein